ncbi:MAG: hypothetical protein EBU69_00540 [Methylophilaceae bacterium]|nr:hypothetical protein [Methylophilaceae bacterium]
MENVNLTGHFLIAMPAMHDPYFAKSVTYICEHNSSGALGVVVNQPIAMDLEALTQRSHGLAGFKFRQSVRGGWTCLARQ